MSGDWSKIFIRDLSLDLEIGINPDERGRRQRLIVNVEAVIDAPLRFTTDDIAETVSYDAIVRAIKHLRESSHVGLVETVAEQVAAIALSDQRVREVVVEIQKIGVYGDATQVGVRLRRVRPN